MNPNECYLPVVWTYWVRASISKDIWNDSNLAISWFDLGRKSYAWCLITLGSLRMKSMSVYTVASQVPSFPMVWFHWVRVSISKPSKDNLEQHLLTPGFYLLNSYAWCLITASLPMDPNRQFQYLSVQVQSVPVIWIYWDRVSISHGQSGTILANCWFAQQCVMFN